MTKDKALKLALEALERGETELRWKAITAIREALVQQEVVLPGGGHTPAIPVAVYGYCPECGGAGVMRERKPGGDDKCTNGHKYPSSKALAQPEQEPVAWRWGVPKLKNGDFEWRYSLNQTRPDAIPLYTTPPQPEQEPVAWICEGSSPDEKHAIDYWPWDVDDLPIGTQLYTSPPAQRTWVGLTDEELETINDCGDTDSYKFARAIEAKLKEKNT